MITVYYENHLGEIIDLKKSPYRLITGTLLDYEWEMYNSGFERFSKKKTLQMDIFTKKVDYHESINKLHEVFEKDVLSGIPGKLHFCESYISCFILASEKDNWESDIFMTLNLTMLTDGKWITEKSFSFTQKTSGSSQFLDFPFDFPFDFTGSVKGSAELNNDHYTDSHFKMIIYGPVVNLKITISGYTYAVNTTVQENEYLVIDSREGTVVRVLQDGTQVNEFDNRSFENSVFRKIPAGNHSVSWSGDFGFDIILFQERSEPKWS